MPQLWYRAALNNLARLLKEYKDRLMSCSVDGVVGCDLVESSGESRTTLGITT